MQKKNFLSAVWNKMAFLVVVVVVIVSLVLNMLVLAPYTMAGPSLGGSPSHGLLAGPCSPPPC